MIRRLCNRPHKKPIPDERAGGLRQVHELEANLVCGFVAPRYRAPVASMRSASFRHFKIDQQEFAFGLSTDDVQRNAAFADVIEDAVAIRTMENYIKTWSD